MATHLESVLRTQLTTRRHRLQDAMSTASESAYLAGLLDEVDAALSRMDEGTFGLCETCHDSIEADRLMTDPLTRFCLDHLTPPQRRALEEDLELAASIQSRLLPPQDIAHAGWQAAYHYEPAGPVSGDYCDLVTTEEGSLYFMLGDVSGKGVPASMLMAHLHALFRALIGVGLPLVQMVERASRVFCESTLASQYATLVCGKAGKHGDVELCNAGHLPPLMVRASEVRSIDPTGLPLGMFCGEEFASDTVRLAKGDRLVLFTDGLSEAQNKAGVEFGVQPLIELAKAQQALSARAMVRSFMARADEFRSGVPGGDDLTLMVIERIG
ncbi:MAG: SpoIIE family protein phosphatase [Acidobacteriia bacterium]|nr:SpoIIE family protein phosphatase [Terriglobia bacterium]